jgi:BirA family transcriptional regulator, biotin operon repressor / biotin---[acetyl-CoA-carboxylase] ligase
MSVLFRPEIDPAELHLCTVAVALAAAEACRTVSGVAALVKWPNDLVVGGSKLAGVLAEAEFAGGTVASVVVGLGVNVAWPGPENVGGTCLDDLRGGPDPVDRLALLDAVLGALDPRRALLDTADGRRALAEEFRQACATLGQRVRVDLPSGPVTGLAERIDDAGHLVVRTDAGPTTVAAGDVVHLFPARP